MTSYCLNPNLALNLWVDVVLQSIITLIVNFSLIKILLHCFFGSSTSSYLRFLLFELNFVVISCKFLWSNPYVFHLTAIFHNYLLLFLYYFLCMYFCLYQPFLYSVFHRSFRIFYFFFISLNSLNKLFTETNSSWLLYKSIKDLEIRTSIVFNLSFPNSTI